MGNLWTKLSMMLLSLLLVTTGCNKNNAGLDELQENIRQERIKKLATGPMPVDLRELDSLKRNGMN